MLGCSWVHVIQTQRSKNSSNAAESRSGPQSASHAPWRPSFTLRLHTCLGGAFSSRCGAISRTRCPPIHLLDQNNARSPLPRTMVVAAWHRSCEVCSTLMFSSDQGRFASTFCSHGQRLLKAQFHSLRFGMPSPPKTLWRRYFVPGHEAVSPFDVFASLPKKTSADFAKHP